MGGPIVMYVGSEGKKNKTNTFEIEYCNCVFYRTQALKIQWIEFKNLRTNEFIVMVINILRIHETQNA